jgi:hypothetical protein
MKRFSKVMMFLSILSLTSIFMGGCKKTTVVVLPQVRTEPCSEITGTTVKVMGTVISNGGDETNDHGFTIVPPIPPDGDVHTVKNADGTFSLLRL